VPGAFMTVMAITLLNQIVRSENEPTCDAALDQLHEHICIALKQEFGENRDGLDIALCKITEKEGSFFLQYAGAHRPLFFTKAGKLHSFAANRFSVGGKTKQIRCYEAHEIVLEKKSRIYAFTDGLPHLPNVEREKFGLKKIMNILESYLDVSLQDQKDSLEKALILHSENLVDIRDDVSFIALEL
jgi:serine phosphatase RsbU (regulator of sigma subunit)